MKTVTKFKSSKLNLKKDTVLSFNPKSNNTKGGITYTTAICDIFGI